MIQVDICSDDAGVFSIAILVCCLGDGAQRLDMIEWGLCIACHVRTVTGCAAGLLKLLVMMGTLLPP
jgi:hypothetical protein